MSSEKYPKLHLVDVMSDTWYPIPPPPPPPPEYTPHYTFKCKVTQPPLKPCLSINFMKLPVDGYPKNRKSIRYAVQ